MKYIFLLDCMRNRSCTHPDTLCHRIPNPFSSDSCFCLCVFFLEFADSTCRFFCSIYFAEQFRLLRKRIFADGEEKYELHFVIDYMSRSCGTRKLLYSLSKAGRGVGEGVYSGRFLVGVCYAVTQFEWAYSSAPVRVLFRCTAFFPIEYSKPDQYVRCATTVRQFTNENGAGT